jgi:hypothetical protein
LDTDGELVFKPTATVALAGLATDNRELIEWGFRRIKPWVPGSAAYDVVLNTMLIGRGPLARGADLPDRARDSADDLAAVTLARFYDGRIGSALPIPMAVRGGALMDYYIDSAYPIERTGYGPGQIRVANYGDGSY